METEGHRPVLGLEPCVQVPQLKPGLNQAAEVDAEFYRVTVKAAGGGTEHADDMQMVKFTGQGSADGTTRTTC